MPTPDVSNLMSTLERFCRESLAMQLILQDAEEPGRSTWRTTLRQNLYARSVSWKIDTDFPEVRASLESSELNSAAIGRLTTAIRKFLALADLPNQ